MPWCRRPVFYKQWFVFLVSRLTVYKYSPRLSWNKLVVIVNFVVVEWSHLHWVFFHFSAVRFLVFIIVVSKSLHSVGVVADVVKSYITSHLHCPKKLNIYCKYIGVHFLFYCAGGMCQVMVPRTTFKSTTVVTTAWQLRPYHSVHRIGDTQKAVHGFLWNFG